MHMIDLVPGLDCYVKCRDVDGARTVDDSKHPPEQEDDDECQCFFTLYAGNAFDEDEVERERRHDDDSVEQLRSVCNKKTFAEIFMHYKYR